MSIDTDGTAWGSSTAENEWKVESCRVGSRKEGQGLGHRDLLGTVKAA